MIDKHQTRKAAPGTAPSLTSISDLLCHCGSIRLLPPEFLWLKRPLSNILRTLARVPGGWLIF